MPRPVPERRPTGSGEYFSPFDAANRGAEAIDELFDSIVAPDDPAPAVAEEELLPVVTLDDPEDQVVGGQASDSEFDAGLFPPLIDVSEPVPLDSPEPRPAPASPAPAATPPTPRPAPPPATPAPMPAQPPRGRPAQAQKRPARTMRLGEFLVRDGLISQQQLESVLADQKEMPLQKRKPIGQLLVDRGMINEEQLYRALAGQYELPFVDLGHLPVNPRAVAEFEPEFLRKHRVLPFDIEVDTLLVATADPTALDVQDLLRFRTNRRVAEVLVTPSQLAEALDRHTTSPEQEDVESILEEMDRFSASAPGVAVTPTSDDELEHEVSETDNAVVRLVNRIIADAHTRGASDIHIEPRGGRLSTRVRFRVDGDCVPYSEIPAGYWRAVVSRIKIMAHLDISERLRPQDGKIRLKLRNRPLELRVATVPTVNANEDVVLRLLASHRALPLAELGMLPHNLSRFDRVVRQPNGLILCVGPTGSGKTTTLHAALGAINTVERKIWTAEDPVEITQPGLRQVQVSRKAGVTFASTLRSFLRADPDVIMIGEMRDHETASIAVESSMTGHLVFSTLHTNSAPETVNRLLDMGLDPFNFSDALLAILAQRLARALCERCRRPRPATAAEREQMLAGLGGEATLARLAGIDPAELELWHAEGCTSCNGTGYRGRVALHELLVADDAIRGMIQRRQGAAEVREAAVRGGMTTLLQDGILKCIQGATDLKRVMAVCNR